MTGADRKAFAEGMYVLSEVFGGEVSDIRAEAYFEALYEYDVREIRDAIRRLVKTAKYFPRPAEIVETIRAMQDEALRAKWANERALKAEQEQRALPESHEAQREAFEGFRAMVTRIADKFGWRPPARVSTTPAEVTAEEAAAHERRKRAALEAFNTATKGGETIARGQGTHGGEQDHEDAGGAGQ